jgi:N-glycosylase/DNA lyase
VPVEKGKREELRRQLRQLHEPKAGAIRRRLEEFRGINPSEYFYEMVYCLFTPQTSAENAGKAVHELRRLSFELHAFDPEPILRNRSSYIRFHKTKSKHLLRLKEEFPLILNVLNQSIPPTDLREWLVKNVVGLGYKEATHFLRNVGKNGGLAILDRHILRNLRKFGAIRSVPKSLSRKQYMFIERRFLRFAEYVGIPLDELDLLFWSMETGVIRK